MSTLNLVKEFHEMIGDYVGNTKKLTPLNTRQLRIKLLFEELSELAEATDTKRTFFDLCNNVYLDGIVIGSSIEDGDSVDKVEELDALCDIQYILDGSIITAGVHEVYEEAFAAVHDNNMAKGHSTYESASLTKKLKGGETIRKTVNNKFLVYRADGKLLKPHDHDKVSLSGFIDKD